MFTPVFKLPLQFTASHCPPLLPSPTLPAFSRRSVDKSWIGADIEDLLTSITGCAATVVNDADAAGYAEMGFGSGSGENERGLVFVATFGTGIGTAMFVDGILVRCDQ